MIGRAALGLRAPFQMGYALRSGISFCAVGDRFVFLDIAADRYFCMAGKTEAAFARLVANGYGGPADIPLLSGLVESGLLLETAGDDAPRPCLRGALPSESLFGVEPARRSWLEVARAAAALAWTERSLKHGQLRRLLEGLAVRKSRPRDQHLVAEEKVRTVISAFESTARLMRSHDRCLSRSIAEAARLVGLGCDAEVIIGVKLRPFAAHAWVECGGRLTNDELDEVRPFTPILRT